MPEAPNNGPENNAGSGEGNASTSNAAAKSVSELPDWAQQELSRARNEAAGYRTRLRETESARDDLQKSLDTEAGKVSQLQSDLDSLKSDNAKFDVALDAFDVKKDQVRAFADRLRGSTSDELIADAKSMLETFNVNANAPKAPRAVDRSAGLGNDKPPTGEEAFAEHIAKTLGWD
jgi:predicted nuclease with TOPRIM domain